MPGVLQRLGLITILVCAPLAVYLSVGASQALVGVLLLMRLYTLLMMCVPVAGADGIVRTGLAACRARTLASGHRPPG